MQAMTLRETMRLFHQVIAGELDLDAGAAALQVPRDRLAYYRHSAEHHITDVIDENFAPLASTLDEQVWQNILADYYRAYPPRSYSFDGVCADFYRFVQQQAQTGNYGLQAWRVELALFCLTEFTVYGAPQDLPRGRTLSAPCLNPTLSILQFNHPISGFVAPWRAWDRAGRVGEAPPLPSAHAAETVLMFQDPITHRAMHVRADHGLLLAFKIVHDGCGASAAAKLTGLPVARIDSLLAHAADLGVVLRPTSPGGRT